MKYHTLSALHCGEAGWVGIVTDQSGEEIYRSEYRKTALHAFIAAAAWADKKK